MGWRLAPLGRYLDVRTSEAFLADPYPHSANISLSELPRRLHELPSKEAKLEILRFGPDSEAAVTFLAKGGRAAGLCEPLPAGFREESQTSTCRLWRPNAFLEATLPNLASGRALDLGCGCGRETLAMAGAGFQVSAIDVLPEALEMGRDLARRYGTGDGDPPIEWILTDLERAMSQDRPVFGTREGKPWDVMTSFRYLHRPLLANVREWLVPGGTLLLETFTVLHRERHGKPRQDAHILRLGEALTLVPGLEIVHFDEAWRGEAHTARLWARRS